MMYQGMFAIITPALISGAFAERMKFSAYCLFTLLWATLVYDPIAHWVWAAGRLAAQAAARSTSPAAPSSTCRRASRRSSCALVLGKRLGYPQARHAAAQPDDDASLGAGLLWFGWFGFNAGSALAADGLAALALVNTHLAAAAGALAWGLVEMDARRQGRRCSASRPAWSPVSSASRRRPASSPRWPRIAIGVVAGVVCYGGVLLKVALRLRRLARRLRRARRRRRDSARC